MRRRDREVTEQSEVLEILERCDTLRIGIQGEKYPYVVPVSFGVETREEQAVIYFHCARQGKKVELLMQNPSVCVEGDVFYKTEETEHGITARYESVIGFGECRFLSEKEEILHGLTVLMEHYGYSQYPLAECMGLPHLLVGEIVLTSLSGKRNLPKE